MILQAHSKSDSQPVEEAPAVPAVIEDRPILVVSNRLPITAQRGPRGLERKPSTSGLVSALEPVLRKRGGTWVGWAGIELRSGETLSDPGDPYSIEAVKVTDSEIASYYHGFSNRTLWPLFHGFVARTRFARREWETYQRVNERFAERATDVKSEFGLVWVHDYHLMLAPLYLRRALEDTRIAFFLHIPFPPYDLFRLLPWDRELLRGLLACDLIGFHVEGYARNFLDCVERSLGARVDRRAYLIEHGDRTVQVGAFPLGIDFHSYEAAAQSAPVLEPGRTERVILGVDRLDYTKGIPERIMAFERLLELHPRYREKVVLLQIAVPSRSQVNEYRDLKREIDELVGRVNGRFATATWSPIRYLYRSFPSERLAALYRDADVAIVTPLRDGMNLVAKEFIACQIDKPGVLILSKLAGAAETMHEAIQVNPYNLDGTAAAIHRALSMDEEERKSRLLALRRRERRYNIDVWLRGFLDSALFTQAGIRPPTDADFNMWLGAFLKGYHHALFLDYDGTLTPLVQHPGLALLSEETRQALRVCTERSDTDVTIVSGRGLADVTAAVDVEGLTYAGNHGLEIAGPDSLSFRHEDLIHYEKRTTALVDALEGIATGGAWTEAKGASLTFHVRAIEPRERQSLLQQARAIIVKGGFQAREAHCAVEARPPIGWDKGDAVLHVLRNRYGPTWSERVRVIYVGDDRTDEDAFRALAGLGITFRVGSADTPTEASRRLANVEAVGALLHWLGHRP